MEDKKEANLSEEFKEDDASWDKEDDRYLKTLVSIHGINDWGTIASNMNFTFPARKKRTAEECRQRWCEHVDPAISKQPWSDKEELEMLIAHQKYQNKWSDVAGALTGRSNNTIKNRFYSIFRKVKNKVKRREFTYNSKLELFEIFHMLNIMEQYLSRPMPATEQKGKRGKDFIYSLLKSLRHEDVIKYKTDLQKQGAREVVPEELWLEMENLGKNKPTENVIPEERSPIEFLECITSPTAARHCVLPPPRSQTHEVLTADEKIFIQSQAFQAVTEPCSAGPYFCQPMQMSPLPMVFNTAPFSAGRPLVAPRFEAFSDYTDVMSRQQQQATRTAGVRPRGGLRVASLPASQELSPPIYAPMPIFGRPQIYQ